MLRRGMRGVCGGLGVGRLGGVGGWRGLSSGVEDGFTLVLTRHGQSTWNLENRFTGWVDVPLTEQGEREAREGGRLLREGGFEFDVAYTSVLQRAIKTCHLVLEELGCLWLPVEKDFRLNERHYGGLAGLNKAETAEKHGEEQVKVWRRSFDIPPPPQDESSPHFVGKDRRYAALPPTDIPNGESLKLTCDRVLPFWASTLAPQIRQGKRLLIAAHGNSLRALVKHLDQISDQDIVNVNIPTGVPLVYKLDKDLKPIPQPNAAAPLSATYLGDPEEIAKQAAAVAAQASAKK